jgi:hypothetical protein
MVFVQCLTKINWQGVYAVAFDAARSAMLRRAQI